MATPVDDWKDRLPAALRDFGRRLKGSGVNSIYAALAAATLWPLIELALGQPGPAVQKIMEVLSGLGSNVTAGKIHEWLEKHKSEADLGRAIETDATRDPDIRAALDTMIERLDAVQLAGLALSPDDRLWFHSTLREELRRLGNDARFAPALKALNMVIAGQGHHVSVVIHQYAARRRKGTDRGDLAKAVAKYLYRVREEYGKLELRGIERQAVPGGLLLDRVYVPLEADLDPDPELRELPRGQGTPEHRSVETQELLAHGRRLVVVGGPGSGKSTVLLHIASVLADALYRDDPGPAQAGLGIQSLPLPVFVPLNGFGRFLREYPVEADPGARTLAGFISQYLRKRQMGLDLPSDFSLCVGAARSSCSSTAWTRWRTRASAHSSARRSAISWPTIPASARS
jgi:hypothetical protein